MWMILNLGLSADLSFSASRTALVTTGNFLEETKRTSLSRIQDDGVGGETMVYYSL